MGYLNHFTTMRILAKGKAGFSLKTTFHTVQPVVTTETTDGCHINVTVYVFEVGKTWKHKLFESETMITMNNDTILNIYKENYGILLSNTNISLTVISPF